MEPVEPNYLPGKQFKWDCPVCAQFIDSHTKSVLDTLVDVHLNEHKRRREMYGMPEPSHNVLLLTPADIEFLKDLKIKVED